MRNIIKLMKLMDESNKGFIIKTILFSLILGILPLLNVLAPKLIIDEFTGPRRLNLMLFIGFGIIIANFIRQIINSLSDNYYIRVFNKFHGDLTHILNKKVLNLPIELTDSKSVQDKIERAKNASYSTYSLFEVLNYAVGSIITGIFSIIILFRLNIFVPILLIGLFLLNKPITKKIKEEELIFQEKSSTESRLYKYYMYFSKDFKYSKDIKIFSGEKLILDKAKYHLNEIYKINNQYFTKTGAYTGLINTINNLGIVGSFAYLIYRLSKKTLTIANFTLYFNSLNKLIDALSQIQLYYADIISMDARLKSLFEILDIEDTWNTGGEIRDMNLADLKVEFKNVSFKYPTSEDYVLENCSFVINPGETVALVGRNGAGKSTIVKLLCKFYEPTSGEILLNGINIADIDTEFYYKILSPTFQDFRLFPFRIDENVAADTYEDISKLGYDKMDKDFKLLNIDKWVDNLPDKKANYISTLFDEKGIEPSGGLGQKLALARSMYHDGKFIIMDEPTSALDPRSEQEIFENMLAITKEKTSLFISHRLSSTKYADRILVCNNGHIEEMGNHDELLSNSKLYSEMFKTQAELYA